MRPKEPQQDWDVQQLAEALGERRGTIIDFDSPEAMEACRQRLLARLKEQQKGAEPPGRGGGH